MIKKIIIGFFVLFLLYSLLRDVLRPDIIVTQNTLQISEAEAEAYIYASNEELSKKQTVMVGSSLTAYLIKDSLLEHKNLGFVGGSPLEGLMVLKARKYYPKKVIVEMNFILKDCNPDFSDAVFNPVLYHPRKIFSGLRDGKQPLPTLASMFEHKILRKIIPTQFDIGHKEEATSGSLADARIAEIDKKAKDNQRSITAEERERITGIVKECIEQLHQNGTQVIFMEMPVYHSICNSNLYTEIRALLKETFPPEEYTYLPSPDCYEYQTSDGTHLKHEELIRQTLTIRNQVEALPKR